MGCSSHIVMGLIAKSKFEKKELQYSLLYNADGSVHKLYYIISKLPYNERSFNIKVIGKALQWEPGALPCCTYQNPPCNEGRVLQRAL